MNKLKFILFIIILTATGLLSSITYPDADFCLKKEQWQILDKHSDSIRDSAFVSPSDSKWLNLYLLYSAEKSDSVSVLHCMEKLALEHDDFDMAISWVSLAAEYVKNHPEYKLDTIPDQLLGTFTQDADKLLLNAYINGETEDSLYTAIANLKKYNRYIEDLAKALLDMIATERSDTLALALTDKFYQSFPHSIWVQAVYYYELANLTGKSEYAKAFDLMEQNGTLTPAHTYITTLYLLSPTLRRKLSDTMNTNPLIERAIALLDSIPADIESQQVLYDNYSPETWQARLNLQKAKAHYYRLIADYGYFGDEDSLVAIINAKNKIWSDIESLLNKTSFDNNDTGEIAELSFWKGRLSALLSDENSLTAAAKHFTECMITGAPRKKYDNDARLYLEQIRHKLTLKEDLLSWQRSLLSYNGIFFKDITASAGFIGNRETRVALGDYNNDSFADILLNGKRLYQNNQNLTFTEMSDTLGLDYLSSNGGLFADFNLDGKLDFMTISHSTDGGGERLLKNTGKGFVPVNDRAGEIDDRFPTEGAAWVDCFNDSYPDLYCANYEKWQIQSGYEDRFWSNDKGYFFNKTEICGFLQPDYTRNPGLAGRGVAPADFDNDGEQEIYVTNYRLDRNFLWDRQDTTFVDIAALNGLQGTLKKGYYGHSIGADWGDFDNDGDLDLFVANLAHPRYIDISDKSMLLRNDGLQQRIIEGDTIRFRQFTDITKQAGITFEELHSDPMWFDADNDGYLDLFITSVYENDRSYLYHNNGDGTFTDITWLAGVRVYNGWGNATADFNHDGRLDLVVGSGNGTKVFLNQTKTANKSMIFKPVWDNGKVSLISSYPAMKNNPNSPAYGTRVVLTLKKPNGKQFKLIRELSSAKGTTSQSEQILHFGLGKNKVIKYETYKADQDKH